MVHPVSDTGDAPTRSSALDDLIMSTNSSSIVSKRSVERLYYPNEAHYFRYFVGKFQRRSPLINRGYWLRLKAIDAIVGQFLQASSSRPKVVINLGCGSDVLPWQWHARQIGNALFFDVDYPEMMQKKRDIVLQTPQLRELLGDDLVVSPSENGPILLQSSRYCQIACDLRDLKTLEKTLRAYPGLSDSKVLFVAEVSITYMDTHSADALIQWASSVGYAEFCLLEQIVPYGPGHPFAQTMINHFDKLHTPPRSVNKYRTIEEQRRRFQSKGWGNVEVWDLWQAWCDDFFVTPSERTALDTVEAFDEWEEFHLFARHYFVLHALIKKGDLSNSQLLLPKVSSDIQDVAARADAEMVSFQPQKILKRRFANAVVLFNPTGQAFAINMMGLGIQGRDEAYDLFSIGHDGSPPKLPLWGPMSRMNYTITDLGDFGYLLVGGRTSPSSAKSDCWVLAKGLENSWRSVSPLPKPLFRHSAIRLGKSSLVLVMGGKSGPSEISKDVFVFHPVRGWLTCQFSGTTTPEPAFGTLLCNATVSDTTSGVFEGLLAGGIETFGTIVTSKYQWRVDVSTDKPTVSFEKLPSGRLHSLALFGACCIQLGDTTAVCGGVGHCKSSQGQEMTFVEMTDSGYTATRACFKQPPEQLPLMIGCSVILHNSRLTIIGGGATCFSMGTFWNTKIYSLDISSVTSFHRSRLSIKNKTICIEGVDSRKVIGRPHHQGYWDESLKPVSIIKIPRLTENSGESFQDLVTKGSPVIIEGLQLGHATQKWKPEYMIRQVGEKQEVIVHECLGNNPNMDFNAKNFRYITDSFGNMMKRIQDGDLLYLRSLSREKPSEAPANMEQDFPQLAKDFSLPAYLNFVKQNQFSSIIRVSGRANMWLHYDVMANVYCQIEGTKRMILFPPSDVAKLAFAGGASSSSLDVFSSLDKGILRNVRPFEALLKPGDVLFLPPLWPHTSVPTSELSIAVNVFFRDLDFGYAQGRDVYGNRDLAAYEKGRQEVARIGKSFQQFPIETRRFYLDRLADELRQAAEATE